MGRGVVGGGAGQKWVILSNRTFGGFKSLKSANYRTR